MESLLLLLWQIIRVAPAYILNLKAELSNQSPSSVIVVPCEVHLRCMLPLSSLRHLKWHHRILFLSKERHNVLTRSLPPKLVYPKHPTLSRSSLTPHTHSLMDIVLNWNSAESFVQPQLWCSDRLRQNHLVKSCSAALASPLSALFSLSSFGYLTSAWKP